MNILSFTDVEQYLANQQVYIRKSIVDIDFKTIAIDGFVYKLGAVQAYRISDTTVVLILDMDDSTIPIYQYMSDGEFFSWIKSVFVRVSEMYETWEERLYYGWRYD